MTRSVNGEPFHVAALPARRERRRLRTEALITGACIPSALAAATVALPTPETPGTVVRTFVEARYGADWSAAWTLICRIGREAHGGYAAFVERMEYMNEYFFSPSDVDVDIRRSYGVNQPEARGVSVAYRVTSDEDGREYWAEGAEAPVIREDGEFRICIADRSA